VIVGGGGVFLGWGSFYEVYLQLCTPTYLLGLGRGGWVGLGGVGDFRGVLALALALSPPSRISRLFLVFSTFDKFLLPPPRIPSWGARVSLPTSFVSSSQSLNDVSVDPPPSGSTAVGFVTNRVSATQTAWQHDYLLLSQ